MNNINYKIIGIFALTCIINSCYILPNDNLNGKWKPALFFDESTLPIEYIKFNDSVSKTIDDLGILTKFNINRVYRDSLIIFNQNDTFEFHLSFEKLDSISISGFGFLRDTSTRNKKEFLVELFNIPAKRINKISTKNYTTYYISARKNTNEEIEVKLGDKITSLDQIPIFANSNSHQKKVLDIVLGLDKNLDYKDLNKIYNWCYLASISSVSLITKSDGFGHYQGINEKLVFWNKNTQKMTKIYELPPLPPRLTREEYIKLQEKIIEINNFDISKIKKFEELIKDNKVSLLLKIDPRISILDYINLRVNMDEIIRLELNRIASNNFGKVFEELTRKDRKLVKGEIANLIIERK